MYCRKCGNQVNEGAKFCGACGTAIEVVNGNVQNTNTVNIEQPVNTVYPQQPVYNQPINQPQQTGANKAPLIVAIVIIVLFGIMFCFIMGIAIFGAIIGSDYDYHYEANTDMRKLVYNDIEFEYDNSIWSEESEDDWKFITKSTGKIGLSYETSDYFYSTSSLAKVMKEEIESDGGILIGNIEDITINGQVWSKIVCRYENTKYLFLLFANKYDTYIFSYMPRSEYVYDAEIKDIEKIYKTLKLDTTKQEQSEKIAKSKLIGEWDWGISGYFVIENNSIYLYKDSSKSMDNVFYGTYTASDKIPTYAAGYVEGMTLIMTVEKYNVDGIEQKIDGNSNQLEFAFSPNADGTYTIKNMNTYSSNTATKIK